MLRGPGRIGGYGWLSTGPEWISELQLEIHPRPREGYIWNCATIPDHRRKGIFRALLVGISGIAHQEGLRRLWIGSVAIPAEKAVGPSGFGPALHFTSITVAGLHFLRIRPSGQQPLAESALKVLHARPGMTFRRWRPLRH